MPKTKKKSEFDEFWDSLDTKLMVTAAHRYCLGRRSYIVGSCIDWLLKYRHKFEENTINVIVRDTVEALQDNAAGSEYIDVPGWRRLAKILFDEMSEENKNWVKESVKYRYKEWPLD